VRSLVITHQVGRRAQVAIITLVIALLFGAVGAYAYDASRSDRIAEGVKLAGVSVGGLDRAEARQLLREEVALDMRSPVVVTFGDREYRLGAKRLGVRVDVGGWWTGPSRRAAAACSPCGHGATRRGSR
jgi:hypothetical protein